MFSLNQCNTSLLNLQSTSVFVIQFVQKEIYFLRTETMLKKTSTNILLGFTWIEYDKFRGFTKNEKPVKINLFEVAYLQQGSHGSSKILSSPHFWLCSSKVLISPNLFYFFLISPHFSSKKSFIHKYFYV